MDPDDHVCLCFRVSLRKIANFIEREEPRVPSQISDCLGAGTGCQWCVPFLKKLHALHTEGAVMDLPVSPEEYASRRARYRSSGVREDGGESDMNTSAMRDEESSGQSPLDGVRRTLHSDPLDD
jgi:bacterioferritin-associated ferredoxin